MPDGQEEKKKMSHLSTVMCHNRLKHWLYSGDGGGWSGGQQTLTFLIVLFNLVL